METESKRDEVAFGLAHEERIAYRWLNTVQDPVGSSLLKAGEFADFDFYVINGAGLVHAYLEVKLRRKPLASFGDVMMPLRKHNTALKAKELGNIPFLAVTEYACGALVEVDVSQTPTSTRNIRRRDRPGSPPVPHAFYGADKMRVLAKS